MKQRRNKWLWLLLPPKPYKEAPRLPRWGWNREKVSWTWTGVQWLAMSALGNAEDWTTADDAGYFDIPRKKKKSILKGSDSN